MKNPPLWWFFCGMIIYMKNTQKGFTSIIIILLLIIIIGGGVYVYDQKNGLEIYTPTLVENNSDIDNKNIIITEDSENKAQFTGFYQGKTVGGKVAVAGGLEGEYMNVATSTCDSFTIISGDSALIDYFKNNIHIGNRINHLDTKSRLVVNIDMKNINADQKAEIINSSEKSPIRLILQKNVEEGRGGGVCSQSFKVI